MNREEDFPDLAIRAQFQLELGPVQELCLGKLHPESLKLGERLGLDPFDLASDSRDVDRPD